MAHSATHFSFFLLLVLFHSPQTQARFGNFYDQLPDSPFQSPSPSPMINEISQPPSLFSPSPSPVFEADMSPVQAPEEEISEAPMVSEIAPTPVFEGVISEAPMVSEVAPTSVQTIDNAYGLYGSSDFSNQVFNKKTTEKVTNNGAVDVDDDDEGFSNEGFNKKTTEKATNNVGVDVDDEGEEDDAFLSNGFNTKNFKEVNNYNQNGYNNLPSNTNYFKNGGFVENYNENVVNYNAVPVSHFNNRGFNDNSNEDGFVGREGMSDTRFMQNGKYSYDVRNGNKYQNDGYESVNKDINNEGSYYGDRTKYEFDSMDEYEREQGYPDNQKYYSP
ncbi:hypothetical protein LIER_39800 [Lithospermum erythrorhizon]|uniref:Uncharacterized protein n=1 Tax=Lithospermum erythrorhizon TaxID=34254 RepID=A0AAV3QNX7_LITER